MAYRRLLDPLETSRRLTNHLETSHRYWRNQVNLCISLQLHKSIEEFFLVNKTFLFVFVSMPSNIVSHYKKYIRCITKLYLIGSKPNPLTQNDENKAAVNDSLKTAGSFRNITATDKSFQNTTQILQKSSKTLYFVNIIHVDRGLLSGRLNIFICILYI